MVGFLLFLFIYSPFQHDCDFRHKVSTLRGIALDSTLSICLELTGGRGSQQLLISTTWSWAEFTDKGAVRTRLLQTPAASAEIPRPPSHLTNCLQIWGFPLPSQVQ